MSMQTLTRDVDAAVAGNSDAYSLALATQARQKSHPKNTNCGHEVKMTSKFEPLQNCPCNRYSIRNSWCKVQWNLVIKRSDITKPSYNKVILLVPALSISLFFYPDIMRNLI